MLKVACFSLAPLYQDIVLGGSQTILNHIILGLKKHGFLVRVFSPSTNDSSNAFIGEVKIESILKLKDSFPSPFEVPLFDINEVGETVKEISNWADRIYLHGDGWILRKDFANNQIISSIHDLIYQEAITSVYELPSNKIIVPSQYLYDTIKGSLTEEKFNEKNLTIIENCITNYSINPKSNDSKNLTLLFPHRPDPRKGLNLAIEIALGFSKMNHWNKVILKVPKFNVIYDKDAKNSSNYDDDLYEEFINNDGILLFHDWIPANKMPEYYSSGDLTLCPGNFIESFGIVPLESVANLTPVLCSSVGSLRDYKNISGIETIPYSDVKEFVRKGELLLHNENKIIEGKEQILKKFSLDKMIEKYISAITFPNKETNENFSFDYKLELNNETYYLAPWCSIENTKIYHDYYGWMDKFDDQIKITSKNKIIINNNLLKEALKERILIQQS